jgi:4a-hydroxytetrahydrobiopterin dehydratase
MSKLSARERDAALEGLPGWTYDAADKAIVKEFRFKGFSQAFGFMAEVALAAQAANHHPDWSNSYNRVTIALSTHDEGGVSEKDIALAQKIEAIASR